MPQVAVILSSVRPGRIADRVGKFVTKQLEQKGFNVTLIDPKVFDLPMLQGRYAWMDKETAHPSLAKVQKLLDDAECFVVCSAEYNHSIPPALTNLMSYYMDEYARKPAAICCYSMGSFGGVRAAVALRPFLSEIGLVTVPRLFPIPSAKENLDEEGNTSNVQLIKGIAAVAEELKWYSDTLKAGRASQ